MQKYFIDSGTVILHLFANGEKLIHRGAGRENYSRVIQNVDSLLSELFQRDPIDPYEWIKMNIHVVLFPNIVIGGSVRF